MGKEYFPTNLFALHLTFWNEKEVFFCPFYLPFNTIKVITLLNKNFNHIKDDIL